MNREVVIFSTFSDPWPASWTRCPDHPNTLVLEADQPGVRRSGGAEFCGLEHTRMPLTVVAEPEDRFVSWLAERRG